MKEYTFKFRHVVEVEVKVKRNRKVDAQERAMEAMGIYGHEFLSDDEDDYIAIGSPIWLGGTEMGTCATTINREGWELVE